jgi:hypothetical protein
MLQRFAGPQIQRGIGSASLALIIFASEFGMVGPWGKPIYFAAGGASATEASDVSRRNVNVS